MKEDIFFHHIFVFLNSIDIHLAQLKSIESNYCARFETVGGSMRMTFERFASWQNPTDAHRTPFSTQNLKFSSMALP